MSKLNINVQAPLAEAGNPDVENAIRAVASEAQGLDALKHALSGELGEHLSRAVDLLYRLSGVVIVTGMGKSGHIGRKLAATLASTGTPSHFVHPADASHGDLGVIRPEDAVLALSWSGETAELSNIISYTKRRSIPLIAMTSRADSALGRTADILLLIPPVLEACPNGLAPTTSTTVQLVLADALAICLLSRRSFTSEDFGRFHPGGKLGAKLHTVRDIMRSKDEMPIVGWDSSVKNAIFEMTSKRIGVTGIVDRRGRLIGVVSDGDLRRAFEGDFRDRPATEIMSHNPKTIAPEALAEQALARMNAQQITALFVIENDLPVGIITVHDLLSSGYS